MLVEAEATEVGPDSRCGTEARRALAGQLSSLEPRALCVGTKCPDDPVYLPARAQLGDLAEAQERAVGIVAILPDGLDEREVLVGLVATAPHRPLHEHSHILQHCKSDVVDVSPLHSSSKVRTYPQLAQVRGLRKVPGTKVAPKSGRANPPLQRYGRWRVPRPRSLPPAARPGRHRLLRLAEDGRAGPRRARCPPRPPER